MTSPGSGTNRVGHEKMLTTANSLDELKQRACAVLDRYLHHSQDLQASQMLTGDAGSTNVVTAEEVQAAQMKIQTQWGHLIDMLRSNTHGYIQADQHNASQIGAIAGNLRHI